MADQVNADRAEEQVSSESGLLLSSEPLEGSGRLSAKGDDDSDASDSARKSDDSDSGITGDSDASDSDASDADGTDLGDGEESESGLGGENPLGINRERTAPAEDGDGEDS